MQHLRLVSLDVADAQAYHRYRQAMAPLLSAHGGHFVVAVEGRALIHAADFDANRVLLIAFDSAQAAEGFFGDPEYRAVRDRWFVRAVRKAHAQTLR